MQFLGSSGWRKWSSTCHAGKGHSQCQEGQVFRPGPHFLDSVTANFEHPKIPEFNFTSSRPVIPIWKLKPLFNMKWCRSYHRISAIFWEPPRKSLEEEVTCLEEFQEIWGFCRIEEHYIRILRSCSIWLDMRILRSICEKVTTVLSCLIWSRGRLILVICCSYCLIMAYLLDFLAFQKGVFFLVYSEFASVYPTGIITRSLHLLKEIEEQFAAEVPASCCASTDLGFGFGTGMFWMVQFWVVLFMYIYIYYILFWDFGGSVSCCFNLFHQSSDSSEIRLFCGVRWLCIVSPAISASSQLADKILLPPCPIGWAMTPWPHVTLAWLKRSFERRTPEACAPLAITTTEWCVERDYPIFRFCRKDIPRQHISLCESIQVGDQNPWDPWRCELRVSALRGEDGQSSTPHPGATVAWYGHALAIQKDWTKCVMQVS